MTGDTEKLRQKLRDACAILRAHDMECGLWINEAQSLINASIVLTFRTSSGLPRAPRKSRRVTPEIASRIRWLKANHPKMSHQEIANELKIGVGGRVSEVLTGQWELAQAKYDSIKDYT